MSNQPKKWTINEQLIEDPVTGLSFQFEVASNGTARFLIFGDVLEFGNREIIFDAEGWEVGAGTAMRGPCRPSFIHQAKT